MHITIKNEANEKSLKTKNMSLLDHNLVRIIAVVNSVPNDSSSDAIVENSVLLPNEDYPLPESKSSSQSDGVFSFTKEIFRASSK